MLLTALVTLIRGVCSAAVTFHITIYPTKHDSTKTVKCVIKDEGATEPRPYRSNPPINIGNDCLINPGFFISSGVTGTSSTGFLVGVADIFGAGGGQVISPPFITVAPLTASSFSCSW